jgi:hypothetical protein
MQGLPYMNKTFFLFFFYFCLASFLPAMGNREKAEEPVTTMVRVTGRVRLVGSSPMAEIVITGAQNEWYVERNDEHKLKDLQHRTVTVEGEETVMELRFANGMSAGQRRMLRNIRIISIE